MPASELPSIAGVRPVALALWFARIPVSGNRWIDHRWEVVGLDVDVDAAAGEAAAEGPGIRRVCPAFSLYGDEAEGYLLNVRADQPSLFFILRPDEQGGEADGAPQVAAVTASFSEAARWLDAGETVERVPLPVGWAPVIEAYAQAHLKAPEEKRPKRRYAASGDHRERPGH